MVGRVGVLGVGSRFEADDSLSILEMHCVGTVTIFNPVKSSLHHNCTVLGIELETAYCLSIWVIPDLDFGDLSLWLAHLDAYPVVFASLSAAIGTIPQSKPVLNLVVI